MVAFSTTSSKEWKTGPITNNDKILMINNVANGVINKSNVSGTYFRSHLSNFAPTKPAIKAGNTVPW